MTPLERIRDINIFDMFKPFSYTLCFDGRVGEYKAPALSKKFLMSCKELKPLVTKSFLTQQELDTFCAILCCEIRSTIERGI